MVIADRHAGDVTESRARVDEISGDGSRADTHECVAGMASEVFDGLWSCCTCPFFPLGRGGVFSFRDGEGGLSVSDVGMFGHGHGESVDGKVLGEVGEDIGIDAGVGDEEGGLGRRVGG